MIPASYLSPKTKVAGSPIHGRGLFARAAIPSGEIVAVKGGHIINGETLARLRPTLGPAEIQIGDDLFICPVTEEEREGAMIFSNHSCDPNLGVRGQIIFVAMRDIAAGEELTHDWAMTDDDESATDCHCRAQNCRRQITGKDWQRPELQERYGSYFSSYLLAKMEGARENRVMGAASRFALVAVAAAGMLVAQTVSAQEAVLEEIIVEAPFDVRLELPKESSVQIMIDRLTLRSETLRALELKIANRTPLDTLLNLTKYIPIPLGASENRVDIYFLQNDMRADLNPRDTDVLSLRR